MSLLELLEFLHELKGERIPVSTADWRPGDQKVFVADITRVKEQLGWEPTVAPAEGVRRLWEWTHPNRELLQEVLG